MLFFVVVFQTRWR